MLFTGMYVTSDYTTRKKMPLHIHYLGLNLQEGVRSGKHLMFPCQAAGKSTIMHILLSN